MTDPRDPRKPATLDDDVDGLLESLTMDEGYREEQATIPIDPEPLAAMARGEHPPIPESTKPKAASTKPMPPPPKAAGSLPPRPVKRPEPAAPRAMPSPASAPLPGGRLPRPGAPRLPRPGSEVRTANPPAVNPAGPPRREPFPPAVSPTPGRAVPRPGAKLQGPAFDDAEIDAALEPLSAPPPPMGARTTTVPPPTARATAVTTVPPPTATRTAPPPIPRTTRPPRPSVGPPRPSVGPPPTRRSSTPPAPPTDERAAESWRPPFDAGSSSLEELDAVEVDSRPSGEDDLPETRQSAELPAIRTAAPVSRSAPMSAAVVSASELLDDAPSVEAEPALVDWEEEPTSIHSPDSRTSVRPDATLEYGSASLEDLGVTEADMAGGAEFHAAPRAEAPRAAPAPSSRPPTAEARSATSDRPAAAHLGGHRLIDAWVARAEWFEEEAHAAVDATARARLLLAASELWAMAGNSSRARDAAKVAAQSSPALGLASRQARAIALVEGDFRAVAMSLDSEARSAASEPARAHAAYVASEVHRRALSDADSAERRLDLVVKTSPTDPRPYVNRLAAELGEKGTASRIKWPDAPELQPLRRAADELLALRGKETTVPEHATPGLAFEVARRALALGDRAAAGRALLALGDVPGVGDGALFLAAALLAPSAETRPAAVEALVALEKRDPSPAVRRALAARSLEQGDGAAMMRAIVPGTEETPVFSAADRAALGALSGAEPEALATAAAALADDEGQAPLAAAVAAIAGATLAIGDPETRALSALGRVAARAATPEALKEAVHAVRASAPDAALGRILALELDATAGATSAVAAEVARLAPADRKTDGYLAAALIEEAGGHAEIARRQYSAALGSLTVAEAAVRALMRPGDSSGPDLLSTFAESLPEEEKERKALILYEAAMLADPNDTETVSDLLSRSHEADPAVPFAARRGGELARIAGDAEKLLFWIDQERRAAPDPTERALASVREALLVADDDPARATARVQEALEVRPDDASLHALAERLSPGPAVARGRYREELAGNVEDARTRSLLLFEAATEYERAGDAESAARAARAAGRAGGSVLAQVLGERTGGTGTDVMPEGFVALRAEEHALLAADDDAALEALAEKLVELPDRGESSAHARLAARIRVRRESWDAARPLVEQAMRHEPPTLWTLRQSSAHATVTKDATLGLRADSALANRGTRPLDVATLALRAAEAAARLDRAPEALALLEKTLAAVPEHFVARDLRARLHEKAGDAAGAAADLEAMARAAKVPEHQFTAWYRAGILYADGAGDVPKALEALEHAAAIDVTREDIFDRLQLLYVQRGDRGKLAALLERRLEKTDDPTERIALEVTRGRALSDVGDREGARRALSAALEASPDHADALEAFAALCVADGDPAAAEQAYIRLARLATEPEKQAATYEKLAGLYEGAFPNPQRAEICYREILKRRPGDASATEALIRVYVRAGDAVKAIELQNGLFERAATPEEKRDRTLQLAFIYDEAGKDKKSAFAVLEKARKAGPHDSKVLRALAEHHARHGEAAAASVLLDRASAEARRALAHGRFDVAFFGVLETAADLRGAKDASLVARATLAAIEGAADVEIAGAGARATSRDLDDLLAPDVFSAPFRALLEKTKGALDAAYPVDLKALRAAPAPATDLVQEMRVVAESMGTRGLELLVSPALGPVFLPVSSSPPRLAFGQAVLDGADVAARYFSLVRALKLLQSQTAAFTRIAPIELLPATSALLSAIAPSYAPQGVDAAKLADAKRRIAAAMPARVDDDAATLALEVGGALGNRASQLGQAAAQWANRAALVAVGSPTVALRGIALATGQTEGPPADSDGRMKWIMRQPEARDLVVFTVSDAHAEARKRLGLG